MTGVSAIYGAQYLMDQDIVLVTTNYRLAALGKPCTGCIKNKHLSFRLDFMFTNKLLLLLFIALNSVYKRLWYPSNTGFCGPQPNIAIPNGVI